jgi:hypothetical protein
MLTSQFVQAGGFPLYDSVAQILLLAITSDDAADHFFT